MLQTFKTLPQLFAAFPTEQSAIDHFTAIRWANGKFCALCGNADESRIGTLKGTNTHKCYVCRKRFSIRVGTIFQDTKLPLRTWYAAIWMITNHPKGIASTTLATDLGVTQKTAWFVLHRLRHAARTDSFNAPLDGVVEVDETFVGGKFHNKSKSERRKGSGRGGIGSGKTAVIGAVSRDGDVVAKVITSVDGETLKGFVRETVSKDAEMLVTDTWVGYKGLRSEYRHRTVNHSIGQYVKGAAHTNTIESVWSMMKRQIVGIHHWVSPKHLDRYVGEMTYRMNRREMAKGDRVNDLLALTEGRRLTYKLLIA
ncbi:MAG: IS1595 family transposase [Caulobacteraceae bacterium]|nr:IS1595 family transposase [Caulobacteraceae bacterium]